MRCDSLCDAGYQYADDVWGMCGAKSFRTNKSILKHMLVPFFGGMEIEKIRAIEIADWKAWCRRLRHLDDSPKTSYGSYTINNALRRLREILRNAHERGDLVANPPHFAMLPEQELRLELSPEEHTAFLGAFDDFEGFKGMLANTRWNKKQTTLVDVQPWKKGLRFGNTGYGRNPGSASVPAQFARFQASKVWFQAALDTGLRKSDLTSLTRRSVRFKDGIVTKVMAMTGVNVIVPLAPTLADMLKESMSRSGHSPGTDGPVILSPRGKPYDDTTLRRYFAMAKWIAGIRRRLRPHDLRHTFGSDIGSGGWGEDSIKDLLGHTSTEQTGRYVRPHRSTLDGIRDTIEARNHALEVKRSEIGKPPRKPPLPRI